MEPHMDVSTRLGLPYLAAAQAQKHVTHNEALRVLDALLALAVVARDRTTPPASPAEGDRYIVAAQPEGAFAGHGGEVAAFDDGSWRFYRPAAGWLCYVAQEGALLFHDGGAWRGWTTLLRTLEGLQGLAIGTARDAGNPFSARLNDALFAALPKGEGGSGSVRLKLNKENATATGSLVYQTAWSGRAELGLCGDDRFHIKVSADGSTWREAVVVDPATGGVSFPAGIAASGGALSGDMRNHVENGDFSVAQRGPGPFPLSQGAAYGFDRWLAQSSGQAAGQVSRTAFPPGQTEVEGGRFFLTLAVSQLAAGAEPGIQTRLEDVARLAGRVVTLSFSYRTTSSAFSLDFAQSFGSGGSPPVTRLSATPLPASAGWRRFSVTLQLPGILGKTIGDGSSTALRVVLTGSAPASLDIADVQVEEGSVATPFARRSPAVERLLARRAFRRHATAQDVADLATEMRATPGRTGAGPFDYSCEL
jgi:hypothetical protein